MRSPGTSADVCAYIYSYDRRGSQCVQRLIFDRCACVIRGCIGKDLSNIYSCQDQEDKITGKINISEVLHFV